VKKDRTNCTFYLWFWLKFEFLMIQVMKKVTIFIEWNYDQLK